MVLTAQPRHTVASVAQGELSASVDEFRPFGGPVRLTCRRFELVVCADGSASLYLVCHGAAQRSTHVELPPPAGTDLWRALFGQEP